MVTKVFPLKQPKTKMVAGRQGGTPIGPILPNACSGNCQDSIQFSGHTYKFHKCSLSGSSGYASVLCIYKRVR